jgi:hypothetical protein
MKSLTAFGYTMWECKANKHTDRLFERGWRWRWTVSLVNKSLNWSGHRWASYTRDDTVLYISGHLLNSLTSYAYLLSSELSRVSSHFPCVVKSDWPDPTQAMLPIHHLRELFTFWSLLSLYHIEANFHIPSLRMHWQQLAHTIQFWGFTQHFPSRTCREYSRFTQDSLTG